MSRISLALKSQYERIEQEETTCYYCQGEACMDDHTPSTSASESDRNTFVEAWQIVRCCRRCWGRIYTANVQNQGRAFGVRKGCMTLDMKQSLIGGTRRTSLSGIVVGFGGEVLIPSSAIRIKQDYMINGAKYHESEIDALQGAFALMHMGRPKKDVRRNLHMAFAEGALDLDDQERYETLLGLMDV